MASHQPHRHADQPAEAARPAGWPARLARGAVIALIYVYQGVASVFPKGACRFEPSCSAYGLEAVRVHGAAAGGWLTLKRILRCRPGGGFGVDPVPPAKDAHRGGDHARHDHPAGRRPAR
jgi:hypothetical protein